MSAIPKSTSPGVPANTSPNVGPVTSPGTDELLRAACYGEALAAISRYIGEEFVLPPSKETLELLGRAFARMASERAVFTPEDYTLYAMSILHREAEGEESELLRTRRGAMRYLLDASARLSPDFQSLSEDAIAFLKKTREPANDAEARETEPAPNHKADAGVEQGSGQAPQARTAERPKPPKAPVAPYRRPRLQVSDGANGDIAKAGLTHRRMRHPARAGSSKRQHLVLSGLLALFLLLIMVSSLAGLALFLPE